MSKNLKIIIPTAGWATRMRPQTWSKPKPLVSVAGRAVLDHLLDSFRTVPHPEKVEYVIIYGPGLGETQIPPFMQEHYPHLKVSYVLQPEMKGQSHALWLARQHLTGPIIICFSDTLIEADFSVLAAEKSDGIAWVKHVPDPRRFGVAEVDAKGWVTRFVEKPVSRENNRVVVGCYYIRRGQDLLSAVEEQIEHRPPLKGEFFLTEGINIMLERALMMRTETVGAWLDTGTIDATLETNRYLLSHMPVDPASPWNEATCRNLGIKLFPPVSIHAAAEIKESVIGPHASIGAGCRITNARVEDSILEPESSVENVALVGSFLGRKAAVVGRSAEDPPLRLNIGDNSSVMLK